MMEKTTDWKAIKRGYCDAGLSFRRLAAQYHISHVTIKRRADSEEWKKGAGQCKTPPGCNTLSARVTSGVTPGVTPDDTSNDEGFRECNTLPKKRKISKTKRNSRSGNPHPVNLFGSNNRAALKHGGYARRLLFSDAILEDAAALSLEDELLRVRAASLEAAENIGRWRTQLPDAGRDEQIILMAHIDAAAKAMDRNTARIESLVTTLAQTERIKTDTALKQVVTSRADFELRCEKKRAPLEYRRRELINRRLQAEIDKADPESENNVIIIHNSLPVPGAVEVCTDMQSLSELKTNEVVSP
jgi:hypothetical protein